jgi:hypothetical protein
MALAIASLSIRLRALNYRRKWLGQNKDGVHAWHGASQRFKAEVR